MSMFSLETYGELGSHVREEWLLTNGLGGFAGSSVVGCNTRRYHGLLCAATLPPVGRVMTLSRIGEIVCLDGNTAEPHELSVNQFRDGFHPQGYQYLQRFELNDVVRWEYEVEGVRITKELQMLWMRNVAGVRYTIDAGRDRQVQLGLLPFLALRDFHGERRGTAPLHMEAQSRAVLVADGALAVNVWADAGRFAEAPDWWYGHFYAIEAERGLDDSEDLFTPGRFVLDTAGQASVTVWASLGAPEELDWEQELGRRRSVIAATRSLPPSPQPPDSISIQRLKRAANDFVVCRKAPGGEDGTTVVAGYPWFADWGRDTMISLPGLLLVTSRFVQARQVLSVFAKYVSEGMIPNRFDDYTNEPHYNTVDASLWFIHAAYEYLRLSGDTSTFESVLLPACTAIIKGYREGTRFNIAMDPEDGLITQGDANTQLTWMDAKCNGIAFTPRQGKAVEINALWYNALMLMGLTSQAARVAESFQRLFWISPFRGLCDVVDGPRRDQSLRPNQIFAVSLPHSPLREDQQLAVVEVVRRELLTPYGLRTLARGEPNYRGRYAGGPMERDRTYHNGAVWPWPLGAFLDAYLKVNHGSAASMEQARRWLEPLITQMNTNCIGQIAEIFEGDEPHRAVGCPAQAWSVAEVLRLAVDLGM